MKKLSKLKNQKQPLGLAPKISLITLLRADSRGFDNENEFATGNLAPATVFFGIATPFNASLEYLTFSIRSDSEFILLTELSSVLLLRRYSVLQERSKC